MSRMRIDNHELRDADIFEVILDNFPDIIHSIDEQGNIVFTNKAAESLLGYSRDELLKMNIREIYAPEILGAVEVGFSDLKREGAMSVESLLVTRDGRRIPVEIRSFGIYDDSGSFVRTFSILRDIRKIKDLQDSLVHAGRLAAIGELASGVAHDINNPLTVITLSNEMLQRELDTLTHGLNPERACRIKRLVADTGRAAKAIEKLSTHLRNFSRGTEEAHELLDLAETFNDAVFITGSKINKSSVRLENTIEKGRHFVTGSPNRLEQIFVNLIANACDALEQREAAKIRLAIAADTLNDQACWRCDVEDNGCGIDEGCLADIFQSFFTTKPKGKGTGLGLSIARGIATDHGGEITVATGLNVGTTFSVYLPRAAPA
jgi:PAS domain S-box-containing protein